jgi:hypothetical protein
MENTMINTTKHMLCFLMMVATLQGCEVHDTEDPRDVQVDVYASWTALTDNHVLAAYRALVKEHPLTHRAAADLERLGCSIDVDNAAVEEAPAWAEPRGDKVTPTIRVYVPIACGNTDDYALPARLAVELGGSAFIDVQRAFIPSAELFELDADIQDAMWLPGQPLETKPGKSGDEPF